MTHYDGPGRRYDPTLNDGKGGWPDPPQPWADESEVKAAQKAMDKTRAVYDDAFDELCRVHAQVAHILLAVEDGPALLHLGVNQPPPRRSADAERRARDEAQRIEDGELEVARQRSNRSHAEWVVARDAYEAVVARYRYAWMRE